MAVLAVVVALLTLSTPASAAYPASLPDFSHPGTPHNPLLSPASGADSRPLLVIVADFSDVTEGVSAAQAQTRYFGTAFGSVNNYYTSESFNRFSFSPATETQGTASDGVVVAIAADQWVDFSGFDTNNDNTVDETELAVVVMTDTGDGYGSNPGSAGTGTIVATFCS